MVSLVEFSEDRGNFLCDRFFHRIFAAYYVARLNRIVKGILDVVLTLPMVLPPTVVGYFLLLIFGPKHPVGELFLDLFNVKLVMTWYSGIFAAVVVSFPLMYRTPGELLKALI